MFLVSAGKLIVLLKRKKKDDIEYVHFIINAFAQNENLDFVIGVIVDFL